MSSKHALFVALVLGLAAIFGGFAAVKTAALGQPQAGASASTSQSAALLRRGRILDRQEAALRRALAKRPPKLPRLAGSATASRAPSVRYVRPAPVVVTTHHSHDDEHEHEHEQDDD